MELRHLRYFLAVADTLSFTRAANQLHVSQPTLSHQIAQLEAEIGSTLFDRIGRRVHLTQSGETLRAYAQRALKEVHSATTAISELEGLMQGRLTIGVFESFSSSLLPPLLAQFAERYPGIHIAMRQLPTGQLEGELEKGILDAGVAYAPPASEGVIAEKLFEERLTLVVGPKHPFARRSRINLSALDGQPLTLLTTEFPSRRMLEARFASAGAKPRIVLEINSIQAILATVSCTQLATILTERMAKAVPGLHCIELAPAITRTVALFWRRGGYRTKAARALAELIQQSYGGAAPAKAKTTPGGERS
ncbi:MAG: transcriptional regulator CynR [Burkholderiales bacterium]|nr:transcriptional regulator CynR [Burkholderiales bacterium]